MHRIDGPGAVTPGNTFTEGDPAVGTPATVVTDDWLNAVQQEIAGVVEGAGITLSKPNNGQLLQAIQQLVGASLPVGAVQAFLRSSAPSGWLAANGQAVSRSAYASLFGLFGTTYGAGNGTTTFNLPDLRGEFLRGLDGGRGVDTGRVLGSAQGWSTGRPKTTTATAITDSGTRTPVGPSASAMTGAVNPSRIGFVRASKAGNAVTVAGGADADGGGLEMDLINAIDGDPETRPRNVAVLWCIKAV